MPKPVKRRPSKKQESKALAKLGMASTALDKALARESGLQRNASQAGQAFAQAAREVEVMQRRLAEARRFREELRLTAVRLRRHAREARRERLKVHKAYDAACKDLRRVQRARGD